MFRVINVIENLMPPKSQAFMSLPPSPSIDGNRKWYFEESISKMACSLAGGYGLWIYTNLGVIYGWKDEFYFINLSSNYIESTLTTYKL